MEGSQVGTNYNYIEWSVKLKYLWHETRLLAQFQNTRTMVPSSMSVQEFKSIFVGQKAFNLRLGAYLDMKT